MKLADLLEYDKAVLAGAVNYSRRRKLVDASGNGWEAWVQAQPVGKKLSDPRRYSPEQLASFLASLKGQLPDPRAPGRPLVKPSKLLKRYLPWLARRQPPPRAAGKDAAAAAAAADSKPAKADPVWQLMQRTRSHPRYKPSYAFDSFEKGWVCSDRPAQEHGAAAGPYQLLAIDCEMCATADNDKELLQVALVDQDGTTIMRELVQPPSQVTDFRTRLTGITAADLAGVTLTRRAAAKRIAKRLGPATVLVGHSLHYDLAALQLDHPLVIDTSMLFSIQGLASAVPSLGMLSEQLLGKRLRGRDAAMAAAAEAGGDSQQQQQQQHHDSVEDAATALALVKLELQREVPTPPLDPPAVKVDPAELAKLCVHRLPAGSSSSSSAVASSVKASLAAACRATGADAAAAAVEAAGVEGSQDASKRLLFLAFKHAGVANDVFASLPGAVSSDSMGRHSKAHVLQGSKHKVVVRKMACHNGLAFGKDKTPDRGARKAGSKGHGGGAAAAAAAAGSTKRKAAAAGSGAAGHKKKRAKTQVA